MEVVRGSLEFQKHSVQNSITLFCYANKSQTVHMSCDMQIYDAVIILISSQRAKK